MQIEIVTTLKDFEALQDDWVALYELDPDASLFLSWRWLHGVFRSNTGKWRVLAVKAAGVEGDENSDADKQAYIGFFPIRVKTLWSERRNQFRHEVHAAGSLFWGEYTGFLAHPGVESAVIARFAEHLKSMQWSRLSLKYLRVNESRRRMLTDALQGDDFKVTFRERRINDDKINNLISPYVDLPDDYQTYLTTCVSANSRQRLRRAWRRLQGDESLSITTSDKQTFDRDLNCLLALWHKRWLPVKGKKTARLADKFREILVHGNEDNLVRITVLWQNETPLCAHGYFIDNDKRCVHFLMAGREEESHKLPLGLLMHVQGIQWAIDNHYRSYDFMHGDEAYKYSFGCTDRELHHLVIEYKPGVNLNGGLDPHCIDEVVQASIEFLKQRDFNAALTGCQQLSELQRKP